MDLEVKERMRRFFFSKKKIVVSEKHVRAVHRTRNQIGVAWSSTKPTHHAAVDFVHVQ